MVYQYLHSPLLLYVGGCLSVDSGTEGGDLVRQSPPELTVHSQQLVGTAREPRCLCTTLCTSAPAFRTCLQVCLSFKGAETGTLLCNSAPTFRIVLILSFKGAETGTLLCTSAPIFRIVLILPFKGAETGTLLCTSPRTFRIVLILSLF